MSETLTNSVFLASYIALWIIIMCMGIVLIAVLRHLGTLFTALDPMLRFSQGAERLKLGQKLPSTNLQRVDGTRLDLTQFTGVTQLLVVTRPDCEPCTQLLREMKHDFHNMTSVGWKPSIISLAQPEQLPKLRIHYQIPESIEIFADAGRNVVKEWGVTHTPCALVIDASGAILRKLNGPTKEQVAASFYESSAAQKLVKGRMQSALTTVLESDESTA